MRVFLLVVQFVPFSNPSLANLFRYKTVSWYNLNMTANNQLEHINDNLRLDIIMETAFPPNDPETYLADPAYVYVGVLEELQK